MDRLVLAAHIGLRWVIECPNCARTLAMDNAPTAGVAPCGCLWTVNEVGDVVAPDDPTKRRACRHCGISGPGEVRDGDDYCSQDCAYAAGYAAGTAAARNAVGNALLPLTVATEEDVEAVLPTDEVQRIAYAMWRGPVPWAERQRLSRHYAAICPF